jgi:very-short-patch-repair endonuclease
MNKNPIPTKQVNELGEALRKRGIAIILEHSDGHKHVDIAILSAKIFIEVDGIHHLTDPEQIIRDFKRDHFSDGDDFDTIHIPNELLKTHLDQIVDAITKVVEKRKVL